MVRKRGGGLDGGAWELLSGMGSGLPFRVEMRNGFTSIWQIMSGRAAETQRRLSSEMTADVFSVF